MLDSIQHARISDTSIAVVDFETTGLTPGFDRVVEVSIVRIDPGEEPRLVFDSLVNPTRPMAATEIHGIHDSDVSDAPRFHDIAGEIIEATQGSVLAAYNVYFDIKFLKFELDNVGVKLNPPHFCLMYLRPMLGLGSRCKLDEACRMHGVEYQPSHIASDDATASAWLFLQYQTELERKGVSTFGELADLRKYKFNDSFSLPAIPSASEFGLPRFDRLVSRAGFEIPIDPTREAFASYWEVLKTVLADLEITPDELAYVKEERSQSPLTKEQIRVLHARAFSGAIAQFTDDQWLDDREVIKLRRLHDCLAQLGWAPGQ